MNPAAPRWLHPLSLVWMVNKSTTPIQTRSRALKRERGSPSLRRQKWCWNTDVFLFLGQLRFVRQGPLLVPWSMADPLASVQKRPTYTRTSQQCPSWKLSRKQKLAVSKSWWPRSGQSEFKLGWSWPIQSRFTKSDKLSGDGYFFLAHKVHVQFQKEKWAWSTIGICTECQGQHFWRLSGPLMVHKINMEVQMLLWAHQDSLAFLAHKITIKIPMNLCLSPSCFLKSKAFTSHPASKWTRN